MGDATFWRGSQSGGGQGGAAACFDVKGRGLAMVTHTKRTAWTDETGRKKTPGEASSGFSSFNEADNHPR